jgi:hypothetical protein
MEGMTGKERPIQSASRGSTALYWGWMFPKEE